jgi:hypothetical protein
VAPDAVSIYVGSLDEPSGFKPEAVLFKRDRHDWDIVTGALAEFERLPPATTDVK